MENKSILDGMTMLSTWHENAEKAITNVLVVYINICDKFKKDDKYGEGFVNNNQVLMGQLTLAAIKELNKEENTHSSGERVNSSKPELF